MLGLVTATLLGISACTSQPAPSLPFAISADASATLVDWQRAGLPCGEAEVGQPGPAVDWSCRGTIAGSSISVVLTVDRHGVQAVVAGTGPEVDRQTAAEAFVGLVDVTSVLEPVRSEMAAWLRENNGSDDWMPPTTGVGIVHVQADAEDGSIELYIVPADSSIMSVGPQPTT
jgi:hypothetical protein